MTRIETTREKTARLRAAREARDGTPAAQRHAAEVARRVRVIRADARLLARAAAFRDHIDAEIAAGRL